MEEQIKLLEDQDSMSEYDIELANSKLLILPEEIISNSENHYFFFIKNIAVGSLVKKGDQLILYIPNVVDTFPDMAEEGWSVADVEAFCNKYGLTLQKQEEETTAYAAGTVIRQSRTKGTPIIKGTTLTITVAIKPKEKPTSSEDEKPKEENSENNSGDNSEKPDGE